jgi:hypothetical protein
MIPLLELIIDNAPNVEIWRAVSDLIALTEYQAETINATTAFDKAIISERNRANTPNKAEYSRILPSESILIKEFTSSTNAACCFVDKAV